MESPESMDERAREAARACRDLLGATAVGWEDPGGQQRKSTRLFLPDRQIIATLRSSAERADLEAAVLRRLRAEGAAVPVCASASAAGPAGSQNSARPRRGWAPSWACPPRPLTMARWRVS